MATKRRQRKARAKKQPAQQPQSKRKQTSRAGISPFKAAQLQYLHGSIPGPHVTSIIPPVTTRTCLKRSAKGTFQATTSAAGLLALYFNPNYLGFTNTRFTQAAAGYTTANPVTGDYTWGNISTSAPATTIADLQTTATGHSLNGQIPNSSQGYAGYMRVERVHIHCHYMGTEYNKGGIAYVRTGKEQRSISTWAAATSSMETQCFDETFAFPLAHPTSLDARGDVSYTWHPGCDSDWVEVQDTAPFAVAQDNIVNQDLLNCKDGWTSAIGIISATASQVYQIEMTVDYLVSNLNESAYAINPQAGTDPSAFQDNAVAQANPTVRASTSAAVAAHRLSLTNGAGANTSIIKKVANSFYTGVIGRAGTTLSNLGNALAGKAAGKLGGALMGSLESSAMSAITAL